MWTLLTGNELISIPLLKQELEAKGNPFIEDNAGLGSIDIKDVASTLQRNCPTTNEDVFIISIFKTLEAGKPSLYDPTK